ncbi:ABC transporter permease/M1 family aminopeptidase [Acanthopleuribacter pedis]|uniref:Peptidase M1 membrane alanine aminopeptidase domain-containing protein n=1 Tax=Acanthopleuribacter pedis TaxID=442870 RepID=A0A8J7QEK5_9BACT|nr:M1 family aminopeptidase [Acanthopleuribacter pedis]MBO1319391.1 hypothetical protein [Acanthopleuribacter pedis]
MFREMVLFEWRYQLRQASFYVAAAVLFFLSFLITAIHKVSMGGANLLKNGPYTTALIMLVFSVFAIFLSATFMSNSATRNHTSKMAELLYCKPIHAAPYQIGRFLGAFSVVLALFAAVPLGLIAGTLMPWVDPDRLGPFDMGMYLKTFAILSAPSLFGFSCLFYVLAVRFRSAMAVYLAALALLLGYEIGSDLLNTPDHRALAALLDPFGLTAFFETTRYWTIFDKNNGSLSLSGLMLWNRVIWVGFGLGTALLFGRLWQPLVLHPPKKSRRNAKKETQATAPTTARLNIQPRPAGNTHKLLSLIRFEVGQVVKTPSFVLLVLLAVSLLVAMIASPANVYQISSWPLTMVMADTVRHSLQIFALVVITYYSAEIMWRERETGIGDIIDSTAVPNVVFWIAKLAAAWLVLFVILAVGTAVTILNQIIAGHGNLDPQQYLTTLFVFAALPWMMLTVAAFLFQVLSPNKYVGMLTFVVVLACGFGLNLAGFGNNLLIFSTSPGVTISDLNGYGWALTTHAWYMLYWGSLSLVMNLAGYALWRRGPRAGLKTRLQGVGTRLGSAGTLIGVLAVTLFLASGAFIYYNTRVRNQHVTPAMAEADAVAYEKAFADQAAMPVPTITKINAVVNLDPEQRSLVASADFAVINKAEQPINRFLVMKPEHTPSVSMTLAGGKLTNEGGPGHTFWFVFDQPLLPGEERAGRFEVTRARQGFREGGDDTTLVRNGTFISNFELFPSFGYQVAMQLTDARKRRHHELPETHRAHKMDDAHFHHQSFLGPGVGFIDFEITIGTSPDQVAVAPGYLQREWTEQGRRWFHYKMDAPMLNFYSITSGRMEVTRDEHNGVAIEVYHHPDHFMNVARMVQSTKDSLDYMTRWFGPYQHRQLRIIEFPRYRGFAQSFANTVPFTEIGFIRDMRDPLKVDMVYNITAHEVAHQWWGHQLVGADVQGSAVLSETLAQYSELMVMNANLGLMSVRRALKVELDLYLRGRTREVFEEQPLVLTENQQYIHYNKGALVMMALHGLLGEERLNGAVRALLEENRFTEPPYPLSVDLQKHLEQVADAAEQVVIKDLFERIILYDLKMATATVTPQTDGRFKVRLEVDAARFEADGQGRETEIPLSETVEIALFAEDPDQMTDDAGILYMGRHGVTTGRNSIEVLVDKLPSHAGVDPLLRFIDRDHEDNVKRVTSAEDATTEEEVVKESHGRQGALGTPAP